MTQTGEEFLIAAFIPRPPVDALRQYVLHRFAGRGAMPFDLTFRLLSNMASDVSLEPLSEIAMQ